MRRAPMGPLKSMIFAAKCRQDEFDSFEVSTSGVDPGQLTFAVFYGNDQFRHANLNDADVDRLIDALLQWRRR